MTPDPPSSPVETTGGSERPSAPEVLNGLTGAAYMDVIRREAEEPRFLGLCPYCYSPMNGPCGRCIAEANASGTPFEVKRLNKALAVRDASIARLTIRLAEDDRDARIEALIGENERLNAEAVKTGALVADLQTGLVNALTTGGLLRVERDEARDEVLRAQLNEATNTLVCAESCAGQSWTGVDQVDGPGKVWRCDTCGRIVSQSVSNPGRDAPSQTHPWRHARTSEQVQAADDRRAL